MNENLDKGRVETVPLLGYKLCYLRYEADGSFGFSGVALFDYEVFSKAACFFKHAVPCITCKCGFYLAPFAAIKREYRDDFSGFFVAEVEQFGKTIIHRYGTRSEYQRVLKLYTPYKCGLFSCPNPPEKFSCIMDENILIGKVIYGLCNTHAGLTGFTCIDLDDARKSLGIEILERPDWLK